MLMYFPSESACRLSTPLQECHVLFEWPQIESFRIRHTRQRHFNDCIWKKEINRGADPIKQKNYKITEKLTFLKKAWEFDIRKKYLNILQTHKLINVKFIDYILSQFRSYQYI